MSEIPDGILAYIGTYTRTEPHVQGKADGVYVYRLDPITGTLHYQSTGEGVTNPSFVTVDAQHRFLYAVQELDQFGGQVGGAATAYAIDPATGDLTLLNHQPTHGAHPCYVSIDHSGKYLLIANYGGGSVSVVPIADDGSLLPTSDTVQHQGPSLHHNGPHPHSILQDPQGGFVLVPDCGLDKIFVYRLDLDRGTLTPNETPWVETQPASGPRHLAWHPQGTILYAVNERGSSVSVFSYDAEAGKLTELQTISTLPAEFSGRSACADIHIDAAGQYVYASNRGHDSIAIFEVDAASSKLTAQGHASTAGRTPRNFAIAPNGQFLLAANQDTSTILTLEIEPLTGGLQPTDQLADVATPVCIALVQR